MNIWVILKKKKKKAVYLKNKFNKVSYILNPNLQQTLL